MRRDVDALFERVRDIEKFSNVEKLEGTMQSVDITLKNEIKALTDSQKFRWEDIYEKRKEEALTLQEKFQTVGTRIDKLHSSLSLILKLMWLILGIIAAYVIPFLLEWLGIRISPP
jgi:uncharacterized membrane protein